MYGEENACKFKQLTPYQTWNFIGSDKPKKEKHKYKKVSMSHNLRMFLTPVWKEFKNEGKDERLFGPKNDTVIYTVFVTEVFESKNPDLTVQQAQRSILRLARTSPEILKG